MLGIGFEGVTDEMQQDPVYTELERMFELMGVKLTLCPNKPNQELKQCGCKHPLTGEDMQHYVALSRCASHDGKLDLASRVEGAV